MDFAVMVWSSANSRPQSIYGVVDRAAPGQLPALYGNGHWADMDLVIPENRFKDAEAAKESIAKFGYYLVGGELTIATTERRNPPSSHIVFCNSPARGFLLILLGGSCEASSSSSGRLVSPSAMTNLEKSAPRCS